MAFGSYCMLTSTKDMYSEGNQNFEEFRLRRKSLLDFTLLVTALFPGEIAVHNSSNKFDEWRLELDE